MRKPYIILVMVLIIPSNLNSGFSFHFKKRRNSEANLKDLLGEAITLGDITKFEQLQKSKEFADFRIYCVEKIAARIDQTSVQLMETLVHECGSISELDKKVERVSGSSLERIAATSNNFWLQQWLLDQMLKKLTIADNSVRNHLEIEMVQGDSIVRFYRFGAANSSPSTYPINESPSESTSRGNS